MYESVKNAIFSVLFKNSTSLPFFRLSQEMQVFLYFVFLKMQFFLHFVLQEMQFFLPFILSCYNNLKMKLDRMDPTATPNPMKRTRMNPVFCRRWLETYFGPLIMALVKKYPFVNPINRMRDTNQNSFSKRTGNKFRG